MNKTDKRRYVNTKFWSDTWVMDELNPLDRLLFIYLLTNDKTNIAGVYEISLRKIAFETGIEKDNLVKMLGRMQPRVKYVDGYIILKNAQKHQAVENPKIKAGIDNIYENLPPAVATALLDDSLCIALEEPSHIDIDINVDIDKDINTSYMSVRKPNTTKVDSSKKKEEDFIQELHALLGSKRPLKALASYRKQLQSRLKTFSLEEIREAMQAMCQDEYMMGESERNSVKYASVEYILRNDKNVDRFLQDDSGSTPDPENRGKLKVDLKSINWDEV